MPHTSLMLSQLVPPQEPTSSDSAAALEGAGVSRSIRVMRECMTVSIARATKGFHAGLATIVGSDPGCEMLGGVGVMFNSSSVALSATDVVTPS
jgi:hypothetical protein